jgi:hypothetical protein
MSETVKMTKAEFKELCPERDKPFYLALVSSALFAAIVAIGLYGAYMKSAEVVEFAKWAGTSVFGLMSMAWTYYLNKKDEKEPKPS